MNWLITKYLLTAGVVVLVSELARRSDRLGAFVAALPLVTVLVLIWLHLEHAPQAKIANHASTLSGMSCRHCRCFWCFRCCSRG